MNYTLERVLMIDGIENNKSFSDGDAEEQYTIMAGGESRRSGAAQRVGPWMGLNVIINDAGSCPI